MIYVYKDLQLVLSVKKKKGKKTCATKRQNYKKVAAAATNTTHINEVKTKRKMCACIT